MKATSAFRLVLSSAITIAVAVLMMMPKSMPQASAASGTDTIEITGIVRDFHSSDSGFVPPAGTPWRHVAGNIALSLDGNYRPVFNGGGFVVDDQWENGAEEPIPWHLYREGGGGVKVASSLTRNPTLTTFDSWDSTLGPYSAVNSEPAPVVTTGATMPTVTAPTDLGPSVGAKVYSGTVTLSSDLHCSSFTTQAFTTIAIAGDVTILSEGAFTMGQGSAINLLPGATLTLYFRGAFSVNQGSKINMNTFVPGNVRIYNLGTTLMRISQSSHVVARIVSPNAGLKMDLNDHLYGTFTGQSLTMDQGTGLHIDSASMPMMCGAELEDKEGTADGSSIGGIASSSDFAEWFADVLPRNLYTSTTITLSKNSSGVYEYQNDAFFPIDGRLFGNEGDAHNFFFTFAFTIEFVHHACDDRFFEFEGADDAWMFVDDDLAMDLGGLNPGTHQHVEFDRLDLVDGETYRLHFFYAQRNDITASFGMRTNLDLIRPNDPVGIGAGAD